MFDRALDLFRDQTLEEWGFGELVGEKDAAKAIAQMAEEDPANAEYLMGVANFIAEIEQAKRAGYVPFARYGDYVVAVKESIADPKFIEDDTEHFIVQNLPDSFAGEMQEKSFFSVLNSLTGVSVNPSPKNFGLP